LKEGGGRVEGNKRNEQRKKVRSNNTERIDFIFMSLEYNSGHLHLCSRNWLISPLKTRRR
jgi:hypothetical protein